MALLRDAKYVRTIAQSNQMMPVAEDACRQLLAATELVVRTILFRCGRFCRHLQRSNLHVEELNAALSDANLTFLLRACSGPTNYVPAENGLWELDPTEIPLHAEMETIIERRLRPQPALELFAEWLAFQGLVFTQSRAQSVIVAAEPPPRPEPLSKNAYIVREVAPHFLTAEASDFLATLTGIVEEYFQLIDRELLRVDYRKWHYTIGVLASHARLQLLLPALMLYVLRAGV